MKKKSIEMHIGKNGLTKGFLEDIQRRFEECENMRINVLKSARESKNDVKKYSEEIISFLDNKIEYFIPANTEEISYNPLALIM